MWTQLAPGGLPWLLLWEARLRLRELAAGRSRRRFVLSWAALAVGAHALVLYLMWTVARGEHPAAQSYRPVVVMMAGVVLLISLTQGFALSFRSLFDARELTLVLTSPLPFRRLLSARVLSLVLANALGPALMLVPIANGGALLGEFHWLLLYPLMLSCAAFGVACALLAMRPMLAWRGPLAARRLLQLLQFAVPAGIVLWSTAHRSVTAPSPALLWLADAVYGATAPLALALLLPWLLLLLGRWRLDASVRRLLLDAEPALLWRSAMPASRPFRGGVWRSIVLKEWRSTVRDSRLMVSLLGQPLMLAVALVPAVLTAGDRTAAAAALAVYVAGQLSQLLCTLNLNAELAPSLLQTAPVRPPLVLGAKLSAALLPVWVLAGLAAALIAVHDVRDALIAVGGMLLASLAVGSFVLLRPNPVERRAFLRAGARRGGGLLDMLGLLALELGGAMASYLLCTGYSGWAGVLFGGLLLPLVLAVKGGALRIYGKH